MYFKLNIDKKQYEYLNSVCETVIFKHSPYKQYQILNTALIFNWTQNVRLGHIYAPIHCVCVKVTVNAAVYVCDCRQSTRVHTPNAGVHQTLATARTQTYGATRLLG